MRLHLAQVCRSLLLVFIGAFILQLYHWLILTTVITDQPQKAHTVVHTPLSQPHVSSSNDTCHMKAPAPEDLPRQDHWQVLEQDKTFIYSAYLDHRSPPPQVRMLGVVKAPQTSVAPLFCHVWYAGQSTPDVIMASKHGISEGSGYRYMSVWFSCSLSMTSEIPIAVSLSHAYCGAPIAVLPVHDVTSPPSGPQHQFVVCICGPVKFNYSDVNQFVEWIEVNSLFGAEKFILYNHSSSSVLDKYVKYYELQNKIDFLPWDISMGKSDIKNFGHMALLNDCLYRYMYRTRHIAFLDLDELLVPKVKDTWGQVLDAQGCAKKSSAIFKNVFYKLEWPDDEVTSANKTIVQLGLKSLLKTKREGKIWPFRARSKYIARPEYLLEAGVHFPHKYYGAKTNCDVSSDEMWVQHYRWWDDPKPNWVVDKVIHRFTDSMVDAVARVHKHVQPGILD